MKITHWRFVSDLAFINFFCPSTQFTGIENLQFVYQLHLPMGYTFPNWFRIFRSFYKKSPVSDQKVAEQGVSGVCQWMSNPIL